jgi:hypothetical protein
MINVIPTAMIVPHQTGREKRKTDSSLWGWDFAVGRGSGIGAAAEHAAIGVEAGVWAGCCAGFGVGLGMGFGDG